ncbi:unnamed protein product, partial [Ectocarpus sp. 12 AP-2014]
KNCRKSCFSTSDYIAPVALKLRPGKARVKRKRDSHSTKAGRRQKPPLFVRTSGHHISQRKRQTGPTLRACTRQSRRQSQERHKPQSVTPALAKTRLHRNKTGGVRQGSQTANPLSFQA